MILGVVGSDEIQKKDEEGEETYYVSIWCHDNSRHRFKILSKRVQSLKVKQKVVHKFREFDDQRRGGLNDKILCFGALLPVAGRGVVGW